MTNFIFDMSIILSALTRILKKYKPNNQSELDRRFDIALIENEKLNAYITQYLLVDWAEIGKNVQENIAEGLELKTLDYLAKEISKKYNEEQ